MYGVIRPVTEAFGPEIVERESSTLLVDAADRCLGRSTRRLATGTGGNLRIWFQDRLIGHDWRDEAAVSVSELSLEWTITSPPTRCSR
jgi:hypothetical protein